MEISFNCRQCGVAMSPGHLSRRYCSDACKKAYATANGIRAAAGGICRQCGKWFPKGPGQNARAICSPECRRARNAESVRTFHERRPAQEAIYRKRTRQKHGPDSNLKRFYRWNPSAPRACESCGEARVLEVAHKPSCPRLGERRAAKNYIWPALVWVLCPTCHRLLDRMNYSTSELGLKE